MQRRDFIKYAATLPLLTNNLAFAKTNPFYKKKLVLIELKGGNDGLNTFIPIHNFQYQSYKKLRPTLAIDKNQAIPLNNDLALHPALQPLQALWQENKMAIVQGVGYKDPNLSHFRSIDIWDSASESHEFLDTGWLGRHFQTHSVPYNWAANAVILNSQEFGPFTGSSKIIALKNINAFQRQAKFLSEKHNYSSHNPALTHLLKTEQEIQQAAQKLRYSTSFKTNFPKDKLGKTFKLAAEILANPYGALVVRITQTGYDTHTNQLGTHKKLLQTLAESLVSFTDALKEKNLWQDTLIMTYSEFGRRATQNASGGTDHGTANTHFFLGGAVKGGLYGEMADLNKLNAGNNLIYTTDFKQLYATVLEKWWDIDSNKILNGKFNALNIL